MATLHHLVFFPVVLRTHCFKVPTVQGKQGKWQQTSLSGKTEGIRKCCQNTGNFVCPSCEFLDFKGKGCCNIFRKDFLFLEVGYMRLDRENAGNLNMQLKWGPCCLRQQVISNETANLRQLTQYNNYVRGDVNIQRLQPPYSAASCSQLIWEKLCVAVECCSILAAASSYEF